MDDIFSFINDKIIGNSKEIESVFTFIVNGIINNYQKMDYIEYWSHRGVSTEKENENTSQAIKDTIKNGFKGVEIDCFYNDENDDITAQHDLLVKFELLSSLFSELKDTDIKIWLDIKNLDKSNDEKSLKRIIQLADINNINYSNIYIESNKGDSLIIFADKFNVLYTGYLSEPDERFNNIAVPYFYYVLFELHKNENKNYYVWNDNSNFYFGYPKNVKVVLTDLQYPTVK